MVKSPVTELSNNQKYQLRIFLKNKDGGDVDNTLTAANVSGDPNNLQFSDSRFIAVNNTDEDTILSIQVQVEQQKGSITPATVIASGDFDLSSINFFTKQNAAGQFVQKPTIDLVDTSGNKVQVVMKMKYTKEDAVPKPVVKDPEQEEVKEEAP